MEKLVEELLARRHNVFVIGDKLLKWIWITLGIEIACLALWQFNIIPMWGWLLSVIGWCIAISLLGGVLLAEGALLKDTSKEREQ